jgi:hypothetical protein
MKTKITTPMLALILFMNGLLAQKNPYTINHSLEFADTKGLPLSQTMVYPNGNVLLSFAKGEKLKKVGLQLFSADLTLNNSTTPDLKAIFPEKNAYLERVIVMNKKSYIFVREVYRDTKTEGVAAVEFSPSSLDITGDPIKLFQTTRGIIGGGSGYFVSFSNDRTKLFYEYDLFNKERKNSINKQEFGFYMFDENMQQLWGGEYEMPYTEAKMTEIDDVVSNDGKLYKLIKVIDVEGKDELSHFEILVYEKGKPEPKIIELKIEDHVARTTYIYEDKANDIVVAGFYSKIGNGAIDGAFMVKLDADSKKFTKLGGGYYEIPSELIKTNISDRQKEKMDKKEKKNEGNDKKDLGINNLRIESVHFLENGSTVIVSEVYVVIVRTTTNSKGQTTTSYDTYAMDIFVFNIDSAGNLAWIRKIPKAQHENSAYGRGISLSSTAKGNDVHLFYLDHIDNFKLKDNQAPRRHESGRGGYVMGVDITATGEVKKYNLGLAEQFETNLYMRNFIEGRNNNLVAVERKRKKNMLLSIDINAGSAAKGKGK